VAPLTPRLAGRDRCVIVADDLLWRIPFEALPMTDGALAASVRVSYATSLTALSLQQRVAHAQAADAGAQERTAVSAAVFAAPVISEAVRTQIALAHSSWKEPDADAARSGAESVRALYGETAALQTGADATEAAARRAFDASVVVHTSAPFQVSGATPLLSYVAFSPAGDTPDADGRWEVREWFGATSHARVLVIADATSFGSSGSGGALDLIAWAAAAGGVPALVVPRAPADGFALDAVLAAFHAALAKGAGVEDAWGRAIAAARRRAGAVPADWAGARVIGAAR
jgi:hypothetical protein